MESRPSQDPPPRPTPPRKNNGPSTSPAPPWFWVFLIAVVALILYLQVPRTDSQVDFSWFAEQVDSDKVSELSTQGNEMRGKLREAIKYPGTKPTDPAIQRFVTYATSEAELDRIVRILQRLEPDGTPAKAGSELAKRLPVKIEGNPPAGANSPLVWASLLLPTFLIAAIIYFMMRRARDQFDGGILGSFVKSPAKRHDKSKQRTTFDEVAGLENAKYELQEIVDFLKNPEKYQRLGGKIPKGVLLIGPPGTGKTLLARAVAGEAGVPFFSISGSEFIQMFVGVGASRVRDMFKTAKENSPCLLFIDEIDAVGRIRGAGLGGGHDEREQTLNQILTEMDGFTPNETVIVLAATNRPDVLDPALLRPGRFDRHVTVDRPTLKGRVEILKVHTRNIPLAPDVDLESIARGTVGMSGADLANLVNESALLATREDKSAVDMKDLDAARDKVIMGAKREEVMLTDKERRATAYHEIGHALVAWLIPEADPVHKVTIIPRGRALGVTQFLPAEERLSFYERDIRAMLAVGLGGRAAERLAFDDLSAGVSDDLKRATRLARMMVTQCGMSERLGPVYYRETEEHPFLGREMSEGRDHSEHTAQVIDEEVSRILREEEDRAYRLLEEHRAELEKLSEALVEKEVLNVSELEQILGKRPVNSNGRPQQDEIVASLDNPS
ncbi:MAG: ATP-dependent zinc metalloprotease FtsH [Isosphaeraceae bacterium]